MKYPSSHLQTHFVCQSSDKFGIIEHSPLHCWKPMAMMLLVFSWTGSVGWHGFPAMCPFCILSCYTMAWCCMFKFISLTSPPPHIQPPPPKKKCLHCSISQRRTPCVLEIRGKKGTRMVEENEVKQVMEICVFSKFKEEFLLNSGK